MPADIKFKAAYTEPFLSVSPPLSPNTTIENAAPILSAALNKHLKETINMDIHITPVIPEFIKTLSVSDLSDSCMLFLPSSNSSSSASTPVQSTFGRLDLLEAKFKVYEEDLKVTKEDLKVTKEVLKVHGEKLKVLQEGVMDPLLLRALLDNCRGIVVDLFKAPRDRYKTSHADLRQQWHDARYTAEYITSKLTPRLTIGAVNLVGLGGGTETRST